MMPLRVLTLCPLVFVSLVTAACGDAEPMRVTEWGSMGPGVAAAIDAQGNDAPGGESLPVSLRVGEGIGPVSLGLSYSELRRLVGEPDKVTPFQRIITLSYEGYGLQVIVSSSDATSATADARVCAVSTTPDAMLEGDYVHGMTRGALEQSWGPPFVETRGVAYFPKAGMAVMFDDDGLVSQFSVWSAFDPQGDPPEMLPAQSMRPETPLPYTEGDAITYEIDGTALEVVDMHLHTGKAGSMNPDGMGFLLSQLPQATLLNFPATSRLTSAPYHEHLGIKAHLHSAGVAHGVLLATYTHHTVGYAENRLIEALLDDARNVNPDGSRWAWGMASINFEDYEGEGVAESRLAALASYFETRPDLFIGIKLAHAHQAVSFEDPAYLGVYDIAADYGVPVLLHTGFSPFPHSMTEPHYYDPASLEAVIEAYDGAHGAAKVDFVLAHAGQGDARAIEHSLQLAERYDNVWLELSAIHRPILIDMEGYEVDDSTPMHPYVLGEIKARGLIDRAIYATDGPQYFGKEQSYLAMLVGAMKELGYTTDELAAVLAKNFYACFNPPRY